MRARAIHGYAGNPVGLYLVVIRALSSGGTQLTHPGAHGGNTRTVFQPGGAVSSRALR